MNAILVTFFHSCLLLSAGMLMNAPAFSQTILNTGTGYYCDAALPAGDMIKFFHTTWIVPPNPASGKSTLYIWNALNGGAMQPVLGWAGNQWFIVNCTFYPNYTKSKNIQVYPGTKLEGVVELISTANDSYTYKTYFVGYPSIDHICTSKKPATSFAECFEAYTDTSLDFPNAQYLKMTDIYYITTDGRKIPVTNWKTRNGKITTPSGKNTVIESNESGGADIYFYFR